MIKILYNIYHIIIFIILTYKILLYYLSAACTRPLKTSSSSDECSDGADLADTGGGNLGKWAGSSMSNAGLSLGRCWWRTTVQLLSSRLLGNLNLLGDCLSITMLGGIGDEARLGGIGDGPRLSLDGELIIAVVNTMTGCLILKLVCNGLFISCLIGIASPRRIG